MSRLARLAEQGIAQLCRLGAALGAVLLLISLALVGYSVVMRYFLNQPIVWVDELVGYLLVGLIMLAAGNALLRGEHIAVDLLTSRLGPNGRRVSDAAGLVAVLAVGLALLIGGWQTAAFSALLGIRSTGYLDMPIQYPQALVPLGGGLLALASIAGLLRMARGAPAAEEGHGPNHGSGHGERP